MQEPAGHGAEDDQGASPGPASGRTWVHPSEVGLEHRARSDRRRAAWLTAGLVLGGIGLLVFGVAMGLGSGRGDDHPTAASSPRDTVAATLASLMVKDAEGNGRLVTGVVVDDDGHVAVRASAVEGAAALWASCYGHELQPVEVIDVDEGSDIAVIEVADGSGRPAMQDSGARVGDRVLVARANLGEAGPTIHDATIESERVQTTVAGSGPLLRIAAHERTSSTTLASTSSPTAVTTAPGAAPTPDGAVFDGRGRFVGLVVSGTEARAVVLPAQTVIDVALDLAK